MAKEEWVEIKVNEDRDAEQYIAIDDEKMKVICTGCTRVIQVPVPCNMPALNQLINLSESYHLHCKFQPIKWEEDFKKGIKGK